MQGSVYKRTLKNGRTVYDAVVRVPGPDGTPKKRWYRGLATRKAAHAKLIDVLAAVRGGTFVEPDKLTVGQYLDDWLASVRVTVRPATHASYASHVRQHIAPRIGGIALQVLTVAVVNRLYADLLDGGRIERPGRKDNGTGLSPATVRRVHATLRHALEDAVRSNRVPRNVAASATLPKAHPPEMRTWTAGQLQTFLSHVRPERLYPAFHLSAMTGMRRGEVLGLRWADVDLDAGRVAIRQTLVAIGHAVSVSTPKTKRGQRSVALDPRTVAVLREHRKRQIEERLAAGPAYAPGELVFTTEDGSPVHPDRLSKMFEQYATAAGVPAIRLHDVRHTYASVALAAGVHPKVVSERLGHASIALTLDTYSHVIPAMQEDAAETVAALVFGG